MPLMFVKKALLVAVLCIFASASSDVRSQPSEPNRLESAKRLVRDNDGLLAPLQLYGLTADLFCRSYFVELRRDAAWGPNHPGWAQWLTGFCKDLVQLSLPEGSSLEEFLAHELAKGLTQAEIDQLDLRNSHPEVVAASSRLQGRGLSWAFVVQAERPPGTAGLYSSSERETAKRTAQLLNQEVSGVESDLRSVALYIGAPEFAKYQRVLGKAFMGSAGRLDSNPQGKFAALMRAWHAKVSEAAR